MPRHDGHEESIKEAAGDARDAQRHVRDSPDSWLAGLDECHLHTLWGAPRVELLGVLGEALLAGDQNPEVTRGRAGALGAWLTKEHCFAETWRA